MPYDAKLCEWVLCGRLGMSSKNIVQGKINDLR